MAVIVTSNAPPGRTHGAEKDRTELCDVASTGSECNSPATPTTATATANNANTFLVNTRSPSRYRPRSPSPSNQLAK